MTGSVTFDAGWQLNVAENYWYSLNLSQRVRIALRNKCFFRQFCDIPQGEFSGKKRGAIFHWNVYSKAKGGNKTGKFGERDEVPSGSFDVNQGGLMIEQYGLEVPYSGYLQDIAMHDVRQIIDGVLTTDSKEKLDLAAYTAFDDTPLVVTPVGGNHANALVLNTTGTPTITNNIEMGRGHVKSIRDIMYKRNIPPHPALDGHYGCIADTSTLRPLKDGLEEVRKYVEMGYQLIMKGEVGRYENTRFFEQTNIEPEGWTNGKSNQAHFFGDETVAEGMVVPVEIRGKVPTNYGLSQGMMWYYLGGFALFHARNDADGSHDARVLKWASAA